MRILVAHLVSPERTGGMSRLMGSAHDELERAGHAVTYLTAADVPPLTRGRAGRFLFPLAVRRTVLHAARRGRPYDVVNVHEPHGAAVAALRRGQNGTAVVAMTHGVEQRGWELALSAPEMRPALRTRWFYPFSSLWQSRLALTHADHVICLNTEDREFLQARFRLDPLRVSRVTPGAADVFARAAAHRTYDTARRLLFAGTWIPRKGTHVLVEAFTQLCAVNLDIELDVLGAGVPADRVLAAFPSGLRSRVRTLAARGDREIAAAMAAADVFVLPSFFEGTPLTLIEAMWSGLPVVTSATAGMRDVVRDGVDGLLVVPGDAPALASAISRLVHDDALRRQLGTNAHATASRSYTWRQTAEDFESAYRAARDHHAANHG